MSEDFLTYEELVRQPRKCDGCGKTRKLFQTICGECLGKLQDQMNETYKTNMAWFARGFAYLGDDDPEPPGD